MCMHCSWAHGNGVKCVSLLNLPLITAGGGKGWSLNALRKIIMLMGRWGWD